MKAISNALCSKHHLARAKCVFSLIHQYLYPFSFADATTDGAVVFNENVMRCRVDMVSHFYGSLSIKCISLDGNSLCVVWAENVFVRFCNESTC